MQQLTLKKSIKIQGIGLHSGKAVTMVLHPAPINSGVIFKRTDLKNTKNPSQNIVLAKYNYVKETTLSSTLVNDYGVQVGTVEHFISALAYLRIDNLLIEIDAPEVPILDGSAQIFVKEILSAGLITQDAPKKILRIMKPVEVTTEKWQVKITPHDQSIFSLDINFNDNIIQQQTYTHNLDIDDYEKDIAPARTFCYLKDVQYLQSKGLALGGSLENAIVIDNDKILNPEGLRFNNEFAKHKVLDAIGDLYLAGYTIKGHFFGVKSGHKANNLLLRAIFKDPSNYKIENDLSYYRIPYFYTTENVLNKY